MGGSNHGISVFLSLKLEFSLYYGYESTEGQHVLQIAVLAGRKTTADAREKQHETHAKPSRERLK